MKNMMNKRAYEKTIWINDETVITAESLNKIENAISDIESKLLNLSLSIGTSQAREILN